MVNTKEPAQKQSEGPLNIQHPTQHTRRGGAVLPSGGGKLHMHLNRGKKKLFYILHNGNEMFLVAGSTFAL